MDHVTKSKAKSDYTFRRKQREKYLDVGMDEGS